MQALIKGESFRFILAGGMNTIITYLVYLFSCFSCRTKPPTHILFAIGIVTGYTLNTWFVFHQPWLVTKLLQFPAVYLIQYLVGLLLLAVLVEELLIDDQVAPLLVGRYDVASYLFIKPLDTQTKGIKCEIFSKRLQIVRPAENQ